MWLNIGLRREITKIRTTTVLVPHPEQARAFPKTGVLFLLCTVQCIDIVKENILILRLLSFVKIIVHTRKNGHYYCENVIRNTILWDFAATVTVAKLVIRKDGKYPAFETESVKLPRQLLKLLKLTSQLRLQHPTVICKLLRARKASWKWTQRQVRTDSSSISRHLGTSPIFHLCPPRRPRLHRSWDSFHALIKSALRKGQETHPPSIALPFWGIHRELGVNGGIIQVKKQVRLTLAATTQRSNTLAEDSD